MKYFKPLILILLIINLCLSNEFFSGYSLNENPISDTLPTKPIPREATFGIIVAEFGGGLVGGIGGLVIGGLSGFGLGILSGADPANEFDMNAFIIPGVILGAFGLTVGCTYVTKWTGDNFHQGGKFLPTLTGAILGALPSALLYRRDPLTIIAACVVLLPVGSVIGYNLSRPKPVKQSFLYQHFNLPSCYIRTEKTKENKIVPVFDFRLVSTRF